MDRLFDLGTDADSSASLFEAAADALVVVAPLTECVTSVNGAFARLTGFDADAVIGLGLSDILRHESDHRAAGPDDLARTTPRDGFLLRTDRRGSWLPVRLTAASLHIEGREPAVLLTLHDRREVVESARALARAEADLRRVTACVSEGVWTGHLDPAGVLRLRSVSPVLASLLGRTPADLSADPGLWERSVTDETIDAWRAHRDRLRFGGAGGVEFAVRRPDGGVVRLWESVHAVPDVAGLSLLGVVRRPDAPGPSAASAARIESLDRLAHFAGRLSHELNNVATALLGNLSLVRVGGDLRGDALGRADDAARRLADLARSLGIYAAPPHFGDVSASVGDRARRRCAELGVLAENVAVTSPLPDALIGGDDLAHVLTALIRRAAEGRGCRPESVRVRLSPREDDPDAFGPPCFNFRHPDLAESLYRVVIDVSDAGPPLSPEAERRLFEPFSGSSLELADADLAAAFGRVRSSRGGLTVWSRPGEGNLFRVVLPAQPPADLSQTPAPATALPGLAPATGVLLVVDDQTAVLDVVCRLLTSLGRPHVACRGGEEAVAALRERGDAVVGAFVDMQMPGMDGPETLAELRRLSPRLVLVPMSGYAEAEAVGELAGVEVQAFLQKPFRLPDLVELVARLFGG